jgi:hypothetical protein
VPPDVTFGASSSFLESSRLDALATTFGKDLYDEVFGRDGSRGRSVP